MTDRKQLEEQFRQAQKMEAVGQLAGGVAHDFNNLLTVINGYSELLLGQLAGRRPGRASWSARSARPASGRPALTRQLLAFSRKQVLDPAGARPERGGRPTLEQDAPPADRRGRRAGDARSSPDLGPVKADPGQLEQVLMNLAVNARDAMPRGGRLTIETRNVELDEAYARRTPGRPARAGTSCWR